MYLVLRASTPRQRGRLYYAGDDRETAVLRHRDHVGSSLYCDGVLLATRVRGTSAARPVALDANDVAHLVGLPAHVHRPRRQ